MVKLTDADIRTEEVKDWKGLHVFHFPFSSCSQKTRIFLNLKGLEWEGHLVDLMTNENVTDWYLGINPRGLVPTLVHDGDVHIESNDILTYLEETFPEPKLIPEGAEEETQALLKLEDDMHLDLRAISFRFVFAPPVPPKTPDVLEQYGRTGSGTVGGEKDDWIGVEIGFWDRLNREGITDEVAREAAGKFRDAFARIDSKLDGQPYILGDSLSALDIAWFIYAHRLMLADYPLHRLHPNMGAWYDRLKQDPAFAREIELPPELDQAFAATRAQNREAGTSLEAVGGL